MRLSGVSVFVLVVLLFRMGQHGSQARCQSLRLAHKL